MRKVALRTLLLGFGSAIAITSAYAQEQTPAPSADQPTDVIVVQGRRLSQADEAVGLDSASAVVAVTRDALLSAPAGVSGLKMLESLPGFNVQTEGALGLYEFGNSVTVRAFNLQQIAFVLDGIPMGRSDAFGGSPIFRYVDNENLGSVVASPGAGDVAQPAYSSLGPIVEYHSIDPSTEFGGTVSVAWGDDKLRRSFVKLNTGQMGPVSAYVSRTKLDSNLSRGAGTIDREHAEAKVKVDLWDDAYIDFKWVYNDFYDFDSPSVTKAQYQAKTPCGNGLGGRDCGYSATLPPGTLGNVLEYNVPGYTYDTTGWYMDRINVRTDSLYGATFYTPIGDAASVSVTGYYEEKNGWGSSPETYGTPTSATSLYGRYTRQQQAGLQVTAPRGTAFGVTSLEGVRKGVVAKGEYEITNHKLEAGAWVENDEYSRFTRRVNHVGGLQSGAVLYNEVVYFWRDYETTRDTLQLFLKDTISLFDDKLKVELGVKSLSVDYSLDGYRNFNDFYRVSGATVLPGWGPQSVGETYEKNFLPMVGAVWSVTPNEQLFASYSQNYALPRGTDDIFSVAPNTVVSTPNPAAEESENIEVGVRTTRGELYGSVAAYYTTFDNRIESYAVPLAGQTGATETYYQSVGGVKAYGLELTGAWRPDFFNDQLYFNGTLTYNKTTFQDDVPDFANTIAVTRCASATVLCLSGKTLPDSPEWIVSAGMTWEPTDWIVANISAKYLSERYSNFINTETIPGYPVVTAYVDFGTGDGDGPLGRFKARLNVDNVFDEDKLAFISSSIAGTASFRPLNPRTVSVSLTADF
ncbi:MAG: TonB-dependent receptor [Hyphomonadaceae bacterium]|nr:TonB-dependent receptor [Hyphomonadaceae bacterium]